MAVDPADKPLKRGALVWSATLIPAIILVSRLGLFTRVECYSDSCNRIGEQITVMLYTYGYVNDEQIE